MKEFLVELNSLIMRYQRQLLGVQQICMNRNCEADPPSAVDKALELREMIRNNEDVCVVSKRLNSSVTLKFS